MTTRHGGRARLEGASRREGGGCIDSTQPVAHRVKGGHRLGTTETLSPPITTGPAVRVDADGSHPSAPPTLTREGHPRPVSPRLTDPRSRVGTDHHSWECRLQVCTAAADIFKLFHVKSNVIALRSAGRRLRT
eukprot:6211782-Pleurochrysis_carterae.AAC.1